MYNYDVVVIGAGAAGLVACKLANGLGKKAALIEKRKIGGVLSAFILLAVFALIPVFYKKFKPKPG